MTRTMASSHCKGVSTRPTHLRSATTNFHKSLKKNARPTDRRSGPLQRAVPSAWVYPDSYSSPRLPHSAAQELDERRGDRRRGGERGGMVHALERLVSRVGQ